MISAEGDSAKNTKRIPVEPAWTEITLGQYVKQARKEMGSIWFGGPSIAIKGCRISLRLLPDRFVEAILASLGIGARTYTIASSAQWEEFERSCYTGAIRTKRLSRFSKRNLTLRELAIEKLKDPRFQRRPDPTARPPAMLTDQPLMTAFHPQRGTRVILDGNHRAVILSNERESTGIVPRQEIMECFGNKVDWIFTFDYSRIP